MLYNEYFSEENIVNELIKIRIASARKRHEIEFLNNISSLAPNSVEKIACPATKYLPPRRKWKRPRKQFRQLPNADKTPICRDKINAAAIRATIVSAKKNNNLDQYTWGSNLTTFIQEVRESITGSIKIENPEIFLQGKNREKKTYRPIAVYRSLKDRIVLSLTARYLREALDDNMLPCVYAFRSKNSYSYNKAVADLREHRIKHESQDLYVAECDLQKFFDTVNHRVARQALNNAVSKANTRSKNSIVVDKKAIEVFEAYLSSYSFSYAQQEGKKWLQEHNREGVVDWIDNKTLKATYGSLNDDVLGIPQGGALSPLIANLVLADADEKVMHPPDPDLFYARFCDDMIIVHPDKAQCQAAFDRYINTISALKVIPHKGVNITRYGSDVYDYKSKQLYIWGNPQSGKKIVPWVPFLGYQIKYNGDLRVRPSSIRRQHDKQIKIVSDIIKLIDEDPESLRDNADVMRKAQMKLIVMSVGRNDHRTKGMTLQPCWADAFYLLEDNKSCSGQMRALDHNRERQVRRLKKRLRKIGRLKPGMMDGNSLEYYGAPYSYHSCIGQEKRREVQIPDNQLYKL
ncbi:hypothetical protein BVX94_02350 [bacterium B17]|nr:hypothetical protein BVX94_02350 [bacterium B17]